MARQALASQTITSTGLSPAYTAGHVDGFAVPLTGSQFIHVKNASGGSINVTVQTPTTVSGRAVAEDVVAVPAAQERMIGPLVAEVHAQTSGVDKGKVYFDLSSPTSVTVAAFTLP